MARISVCLMAACCCLFCLSLLPPPPAQGHRRPGLQAAAGSGGGLGGRRLLRLLPAPEPHFVPTEATAEEERRGGVPAVATKARPAAWGVRAELRAVPGGPDPLHHHGGSPSSRRPDQDRAPASP